MFLDFVEIDGTNHQERINKLYDLIQEYGPEWLQQQVIDFIESQKERIKRNEITASTIPNYIKPIKTFCYMNNILINWKLIEKRILQGRKSSTDRAHTYKEIQKLLTVSDIRLKPLVYTMISSGIRVGAWGELQWKHVTHMKDKENGNIIAAKLIIYPGDEEEYYTFITLEAYHSLINWKKFREKEILI